MSCSSCGCGSLPTLIFACSGAADVGAIADKAARQMTREGIGKMSCLAGIGGRVSGMMASAAGAAKLLAIDGCAQSCAKKCLEHAGFTNFAHVQLAELGMEKGKSTPTVERVNEVVRAGAAALATQP
jgi:uncharacterized metal-binding protein